MNKTSWTNSAKEKRPNTKFSLFKLAGIGIAISISILYSNLGNTLNPVVTTNFLKSGNGIENSVLSSVNDVEGALSDDLFSEDFSSAMQKLLPEDGKFKPLDLAALKEFGIQQLTGLAELSDIQLPSKTTELKALFSQLSLETDSQIGNVDLFGNPDANALLKTNLIDSELLEEGISNKSVNKSDLLAGKIIATDDIQQSLLKKDADLSLALDDVDLSKYMKDLVKGDVELGSELFSQVGRQETNTTKLIDQLVNMEKPVNPLNSVSNASLKTYSSPEQSGAMLSRIEVPVTQPGWSEAVGNRLMMMVSGKIQSANIHLNPAELGPIEIRVNVNQEQATVHFVSNNSVVRDAIEDAFPRLKEMFMQNGLSLADANVSEQSSQQGSQYSNEENDPTMSLNNESLDADDSEKISTNNNVIDIGLVDQYV